MPPIVQKKPMMAKQPLEEVKQQNAYLNIDYLDESNIRMGLHMINSSLD